MRINTGRFGCVGFGGDDVLRFPGGLLGWEGLDRWLLMPDPLCASLAWVQCVDEPNLALAVVCPWRFVPTYRLRVPAAELERLQLQSLGDATVLAIVAKTDGRLTMNLRAPVVLNSRLWLGTQVLNAGKGDIRHPLELPARDLKRTA